MTPPYGHPSSQHVHRAAFSFLTFLFLAGFLALTSVVEVRAQAQSLADLNVLKSGDETARRGGTITYNVVVTNAGPDTATNVVISDPIPTNTSFVSATLTAGEGTLEVDETSVTARFSSIPAFESGGFTLVVSVHSDVPPGTVITNNVTARSDAADPNLEDNTANTITVITGPFGGDVLISEFRLRGPAGATDEFIEIYNNAETPHAVQATDGSEGYAIAASDGVVRCVVPNRTILPARGHFLCVNQGYSLGLYPAGEDSTANGDATYSVDVPDNAGLAIFSVSNPQNFTLNNRLDAVGSTSEPNALYKEGTGYPALSPLGLDYAFYRDNCGKGGSVTVMGNCPTAGLPKDSDNNAVDFIFVSSDGNSSGAGARLGMPGPENRLGPTQRNESFSTSLLDPCVGGASAPNRARDFASDPVNHSTFGTLDIRRSITNVTQDIVTRLRYRIIDITTYPTPDGVADLRARSSPAIEVTVDRAPCGSETSSVTVQGTTLENLPLQMLGGGFNSSLSSGTVALATPLQPGETINVRFLLGVEKTGVFKFFVNIEALTREPIIPPDQDPPAGGSGRRSGSLARKRRDTTSISSSTTSGVIAPPATTNVRIPSAPTNASVSVPPANVGRVLLVLPRETKKVRKTKKQRRQYSSRPL